MLRQSRYNIATTTESGEHLIYNTASGAFAVLDDAAVAALGNPQTADPALVDALEQASFLTQATPEEELDAQHAMFEAQRHVHDELMLVLAPTYACNYRCPYCYEQGHNAIPGIWDDEVIEAVYDFIEDRYAEHAFTRLTIEWYGGDPSLALDVVEKMSEWMMAWCDERGIVYDAMMLTNCNLIDERAASMLARCKVSSVYITIDGFEETHNKRRVAANGSNSFERNVTAAKLFAAHGIKTLGVMNVDHVNWPQFHDLRDWLREETELELTCGRLCDYGHFFGTRGFEPPTFDLFTHEEYAQLDFEEFAAAGYGPEMYRERLSPAPRFCNGQRADYYVIDRKGDIYTCDGWIGEQDHVVGSIFDELDDEQLDMVSHDPYASEQCSACELLPLCQGNCDWERRCTDMQCHPLRITLPDHLRAWRALLGKSEGSFTLLNEPMR